jgi:hypothetical protein
MAAASTTGFDVRGITQSAAAPAAMKSRRRYITSEAGHALEILSHAIEYLTDELVHEGKTVSAHHPQVEAIQLLMTLNRQVYYECPQIPTLSERLRVVFHSRHAAHD